MRFHLLLVLFVISALASRYPEDFTCPICEDYVKRSLLGTEDPKEVCSSMKACSLLQKEMPSATRAAAAAAPSAFAYCGTFGLCPTSEKYTSYLAANAGQSPLSLRVTRGFGPLGYNRVRISVIDNTTMAATRSPSFRGFFDYDNAFRYRWTSRHLFSTVRTVTPGKASTFSIGGYNVTVRLPAEDGPSRGVFLADPCFSSRYIWCTYGDSLQILPRLTQLLNAMTANPDPSKNIDYWMILGDMFYDRDGSITDEFFSLLSQQTQSTLFGATAGNHDYWVLGSPWLASSPDSFGNGYMQFYTMDTAAVTSSPNGLFNFTNDPDHPSSLFDDRTRIGTPDNFFYYNKIGNVAFMGYSGAYTWSTMLPYFQQGCQWMNSVKPAVAFLIGHWNAGGQGCDANMAVPAAYAQLKSVPGCSDLGTKFKFVMGHTHCNQVVEPSTGYMVAGFGMEGCGNFGIPYVDTSDGRLEVLYFPVADSTGVNNFNATLACITQNGIGGCKQLATVWYNESLSNL